MKMENFKKTTYIIGKLRKKYVENAYQTIFLSTLQYHKHELEIARFGAPAPRAETVDVKYLIYMSHTCTVKINLNKSRDNIKTEFRFNMK